MSCDVGEATEGLENELWCRSSDGKSLALHLRHLASRPISPMLKLCLGSTLFPRNYL